MFVLPVVFHFKKIKLCLAIATIKSTCECYDFLYDLLFTKIKILCYHNDMTKSGNLCHFQPLYPTSCINKLIYKQTSNFFKYKYGCLVTFADIIHTPLDRINFLSLELAIKFSAAQIKLFALTNKLQKGNDIN